MIKKQLLTLLLFAFGFSQWISAQGIAIGEWRTHLPYDKIIDVAVAGDIVFAASPYSMFTYNTGDNSMVRFDKVKGLSDVGIVKIRYNPQIKSLLVAYTNTNLDIVHEDGSIVNISDIKDKDILGKKTINNILFKDELAYLSCGFGIVVLNMEKEEIADTYFIGPNGDAIEILDMTFNDTSFFAATESGIYYADVDAPHLADFNQWHKDLSMPQPDLLYSLVESFGGKVYCNYFNGGWDGDTLYVFDGQKWDYFEKQNNNRHFQLSSNKDELLLVNRSSFKTYNSEGKLLKNVWKIEGEGYRPLAVDRGNTDFFWIGDNSKGLIKNWGGTNGEYIKPNGPGTKNVYALDAAGGNVWVAPGGRQSNWSKLNMRDGVFSFVDDFWTTHDSKNEAAFDTVTDMVSVKVDPANPNIAYIGTWKEGVFKFVDNELNLIYNESNSSLQRWVADPSLMNISGLDFDNQHNLWVANTGASDLLSVMKNNGQWRSFNLGGSLSGTDIADLMVDNYNQKWIIKRTDGYIIVFNDNNTLDDPSDDQVRVLNAATGNGAIPGSRVRAFATDHDGEVWVGTDKGIAVFYSPDRIFSGEGNFDAQQILVPRNDGSGLADILLETETVTAITIDGANQKWIGTDRAGVFLLSDDGLVEKHHFTAENSPLLSNSITGIAIKDNGEVFIGTASGIVSFRGTATPPPQPGTDVYAYPNPVRENYEGPIAIKGLADNSIVKITDNYGNIVYQTTSEGSQAVWDGYNFDGRRAATGVYMVFATTNDGSDKLVTKILVVR
ncbi:MAG: hypothetical protein L3J31_00685 [Bacteroidales bacterium]|nr:hypothetical protein [Bacteroidales bacterium]MCF6341306.1 hypothetical protein [Bacteroidales bacterium]